MYTPSLSENQITEICKEDMYLPQSVWWKGSAMISLVNSILTENRWNIYDKETETFSNFSVLRDAIAMDSLINGIDSKVDLIKVHLPRREDLLNCEGVDKVSYSVIYREVSNECWLETFGVFKNYQTQYGIDPLFSSGYHYSAKGYEIIAEALVKELMKSNY